MTETNKSCFICRWSPKWKWKSHLLLLTCHLNLKKNNTCFPYIAHLTERKLDEASGKLNKRGQKHYWNICIRAAQHVSLLGLKHDNIPRTPSHNGMSQNATQQNINSKHTHTHKICFKDASLNLCYIKLSEALGKRAIVTKINPAADLSYNIISNSSRRIYKCISAQDVCT